MKKSKKLISILLITLLALVTMTGCSSSDDEETTSGMINVTIIQVLEDETEETNEITVTEGSTLREALYEAGMIEEDELASYFVTTINGHSADALNDGVTWLVTDENDEQIEGTFDEIFPTDGQTIKLVYYVVPNFD